MDSMKCDRFKTFREELPNKKFLYLNDDNSIHKIKLMYEDASNQNKANEAGDKVINVEEQQNKDGEIEVVQIVNTGLFRDNQRRIDLVLVVEDDPLSRTDSLKMNFLTNIVKVGLEIEIEPGVMPFQKNIFFIKLHAPNNVLEEYNEIFAVKRYFVDSRLDYMSPKPNNIKNGLKILSTYYEKEWIKIVRNNYIKPNGYSNYERSLIIYKILLFLPFGDHVNYCGIKSLLKKNIILDVFALHDGPYFFLPKQIVSEANARQLLYYNWSGIQNLFKSQPLHLIHEYFGPRVAFYFAFYGYFNKALAVAGIGGFITTMLPLIDKSEDILRKLICEAKLRMCPYCDNWNTCPYRNSEEYCLSAAINVILDNPHTPYFSIFIIIWAFAFLALWKRKEYFLRWMWEVGGYGLFYKIAIRPEYKINYKPARKSLITGLKYNESGYYKLFRFLISKIIIILYVLAIIPLMAKSLKIHDKFLDAFIANKKREKWWDYVGLAMFQTLHVVVVSALEMIYHYMCYYLVKIENHRTYKAHEKSLITKQFGFSVVLLYSFMSYYSWLVGHYIYLGRCPKLWNVRYSFNAFEYFRALFVTWIRPWIIIQNDCDRYCWPYTCINEVCILLVVLVLMKAFIFRLPNYISSMWTDYNRGGNATIPCWEREYKLSAVDETYFTKKYFILAIQFTMVTLFISSFPLTPLLILLINIWDIRHTARQLLLTKRRPLLIRSPGIGAWKNILLFVSFAAIITNALTIAFNTKLIMRYYFKSIKKPLNATLEMHLAYLKVDPRYYRAKECYSPDWLEISNHKLWGLMVNLFYGPRHHILYIYKIVFIFLFINIMVCAAFLIQYLFPPDSKIKEAKDAERRLKIFYRHYKTKKTNLETGQIIN